MAVLPAAVPFCSHGDILSRAVHNSLIIVEFFRNVSCIDQQGSFALQHIFEITVPPSASIGD